MQKVLRDRCTLSGRAAAWAQLGARRAQCHVSMNATKVGVQNACPWAVRAPDGHSCRRSAQGHIVVQLTAVQWLTTCGTARLALHLEPWENASSAENVAAGPFAVLRIARAHQIIGDLCSEQTWRV